MNNVLKNLTVYGIGGFALVFMLSFTSLAIIPNLVSLALLAGVEVVWALLFVIGMPFGGFVVLLIFTPRERWAVQCSRLAGLWVGVFSGSLLGTTLAEGM